MNLNIKVSSDSRTIKQGEYFVPFKGEDFDGNDYIQKALDKGAAGIMQPEELYELAKDKLKADKTKIVGITGSVGKTTTKDALVTVLTEKFNVLGSSGNRNTLLGLAMDIVNNLKPEHEIFVAEIAMDRLGEITETCTYIKPDIGVITNISGVHKEKLKTLKNIIKAKGELLETMNKNALAFLNKEDVNVCKLQNKGSCKKVMFETNELLKTSLIGSHARFVATVCELVGTHLGMSEKDINKGLLKLKNTKGRLQTLEGINNSIVLDDTYNASPVSVKAGIDYISPMKNKSRICILGDMLELGKNEIELHENVIKYSLKNTDEVILVGKRMKEASRNIKETITTLEKSSDFEPTKHLNKEIGSNTIFFIKGSRGIRMERAVEKLLNNPEDKKLLI